MITPHRRDAVLAGIDSGAHMVYKIRGMCE